VSELVPDQEKRLVWEAKGIAKIINRPVRSTVHLLETGVLPATKIGGRWVSSEEALLEFIHGAIRKSAGQGVG
jgi:hypothetical protein